MSYTCKAVVTCDLPHCPVICHLTTCNFYIWRLHATPSSCANPLPLRFCKFGSDLCDFTFSGTWYCIIIRQWHHYTWQLIPSSLNLLEKAFTWQFLVHCVISCPCHFATGTNVVVNSTGYSLQPSTRSYKLANIALTITLSAKMYPKLALVFYPP